jgi:MFS superfamily sulfate permease-like transporter
MYTLHEFIDDHFGVGDTRLMYGITVPLLLGVVCISLLIGFAEWWLLAPTVLCVIALTITVCVGISRMLAEEESEPPKA